MPSCVALTKKRTPCKNPGNAFESHCTIHHEHRCRTDPAFNERSLAALTVLRELRIAQSRETNRIVMSTVAPTGPVLVPLTEELSESRAAAARAEKQSRNARILEDLNIPTTHKVMSYATKLMNAWQRDNIPGMDCSYAYAILKHKMIFTEALIPHVVRLVRAVATVYLLTGGHHPIHPEYATVPQAEKTEALNALRFALIPFGDINLRTLVPTNDSFRNTIVTRLHEHEAAQRRAAAEEAVRIAAEERRRQLVIDLRERPVVFQRDPEGSINLTAFATDGQNVHRSSVQNATHKAVLTLLKRPLAEGQDTLPELVLDLQNPSSVRVNGVGVRERIIAEVTHDYFETEAFSVKYGDVLDRVWAYIRAHEHRSDLFIRLAQEIAEGISQCSNGKMARLVNALQGFDDTLEMEAPKELFQNKIALVMSRPLAEREAEARALFTEYSIPEVEQAAWLEPLLEV